MDIHEIDLGDKLVWMHGYTKGYEKRLQLNLDVLELDDKIIVINVDSGLIFTSAFLFGLFERSINDFKGAFFKKYKFEGDKILVGRVEDDIRRQMKYRGY